MVLKCPKTKVRVMDKELGFGDNTGKVKLHPFSHILFWETPSVRHSQSGANAPATLLYSLWVTLRATVSPQSTVCHSPQ